MFSLFFLGFIAVALIWFYYLDLIIKYQYFNDHNAWKDDGCPRGFFFNPKGGSWMAWNLIGYRWLSRQPDWISNDRVAMTMYGRLKNLYFFIKCYCIVGLILLVFF